MTILNNDIAGRWRHKISSTLKSNMSLSFGLQARMFHRLFPGGRGFRSMLGSDSHSLSQTPGQWTPPTCPLPSTWRTRCCCYSAGIRSSPARHATNDNITQSPPSALTPPQLYQDVASTRALMMTRRHTMTTHLVNTTQVTTPQHTAGVFLEFALLNAHAMTS